MCSSDLDPEALTQLLAPGFDADEWDKLPVATKGLPASPGAASGQVVFSADRAVEWSQQGKPVILVRRETVPDDIHGMEVAAGILTSRGGMTSHAAVVARGMGRPCVSGAGEVQIFPREGMFRARGREFREGEIITIDGSTEIGRAHV